MAAIVVDSSTWIDHFAGRTVKVLEDAVAEGRLVLSPLVVAEVISGATTIEQRNTIGEWLEEVPVYPASLGHWIHVGLLRQQLRRKGLTVTLPDAHVAQCAIDLDALLLTRDDIFPLIARHTSLRVTSAAS